MKLETQIKDLLYQYDCVIVPGFGGFICSFSPAKIHPVQHKFYPPSKLISFNQLLQVNDGLLAHYCARTSGRTYEAGVEWVQGEVKSWKSKLSAGEELVLADIGRFFNDQGGNLQFVPSGEVNFLKESYGLTVFQSTPVQKLEPLKVVHKSTSPNESETPSAVDWSKLAKYSAAAAIISIVSLTTFKLNLIQDLKFNHISLNPFKTEMPAYKYAAHADYANWTENDLKGQSLDFKTDASFVNYTLDGKKLVVQLHDKIVESRAELPAKMGSYHVVGGCFGVEANALKFTSTLKKQGFSAQMPGKHKDLFVVSYQSFDTKKEAKLYLKKIQSEQNAQAWVLKK